MLFGKLLLSGGLSWLGQTSHVTFRQIWLRHRRLILLSLQIWDNCHRCWGPLGHLLALSTCLVAVKLLFHLVRALLLVMLCGRGCCATFGQLGAYWLRGSRHITLFSDQVCHLARRLFHRSRRGRFRVGCTGLLLLLWRNLFDSGWGGGSETALTQLAFRSDWALGATSRVLMVLIDTGSSSISRRIWNDIFRAIVTIVFNQTSTCIRVQKLFLFKRRLMVDMCPVHGRIRLLASKLLNLFIHLVHRFGVWGLLLNAHRLYTILWLYSQVVLRLHLEHAGSHLCLFQIRWLLLSITNLYHCVTLLHSRSRLLLLPRYTLIFCWQSGTFLSIFRC